ncbi:MAG: PIN domain-containing protein [Leptospirales bacterium]
MSKLYVYLIAAGIAALTALTTEAPIGFIAAGIAIVIIVVTPFIIDLIKNKSNRGSVTSVVVGLIVAIVGFGLLTPFLAKYPIYVSNIVLGTMLTLVSYTFYRFQRDGGLTGVGISGKPEVSETHAGDLTVKILDTSIVIDGRIIDLASTGFIEGPLIVPNFVLREIQLISDSADAIKRNRGRRGLEMLNALQKRDDLEVRISYVDYTDTREVDAKLVKLAREMGGKLITNDFNLNKVAELQEVDVLNINNLANALKPVVLPGEEMEVQVVKEGKDDNQGIGYLEDGTMVVIENARKLLGKKLRVDVTSVIQTNAGKMIFTKVATKS